MKIRCNLNFDAAKDAGARTDDPDKSPEQIVKEWHKRWPMLRFCKHHRGWVYKAECKRCSECIEVIKE